ncbi:MAG TPA: type II toxin-antitoxin system prevent-host-death family antitoxin [Anaerolineae bacterium]|nr:type II toxin-antitoxin system prevent-host-death family antitoxin [Anaerolineae bacterium]
MEFVSVRDLRIQPGQVWKRLAETGELIITSHGKPIALLAGVTDATLEQTLTALRRARAQVAASQLRAAAQARGTDKMSMREIDAEIKAARRERRKSARKRL